VAFLGGTRKPVLFPNPANDQLNVAFHCPTDGEATLLVLDATGRTVAQSSTQVQRGEQAITLPMADLAKGWYNLHILLPDGSTLPGNGFLKR